MSRAFVRLSRGRVAWQHPPRLTVSEGRRQRSWVKRATQVIGGWSMLTEYIQAAMRRAKYEILEDDKSFYGWIPYCQGVWANAPTLEGCRDELQEVLED